MLLLSKILNITLADHLSLNEHEWKKAERLTLLLKLFLQNKLNTEQSGQQKTAFVVSFQSHCLYIGSLSTFLRPLYNLNILYRNMSAPVLLLTTSLMEKKMLF